MIMVCTRVKKVGLGMVCMSQEGTHGPSLLEDRHEYSFHESQEARHKHGLAKILIWPTNCEK